MGDAADDAFDSGLRDAELSGDYSWVGIGHRLFVRAHIKQKNSKVFSAFARDGSNFKTNDRLVHKPSGVAGVVLATRGTQICWRPDTRLKPGGVWVDSDKLRFDI